MPSQSPAVGTTGAASVGEASSFPDFASILGMFNPGSNGNDPSTMAGMSPYSPGTPTEPRSPKNLQSGPINSKQKNNQQVSTGSIVIGGSGSSATGGNTGMIVGIVAGVIVLFLIILFLLG